MQKMILVIVFLGVPVFIPLASTQAQNTQQIDLSEQSMMFLSVAAAEQKGHSVPSHIPLPSVHHDAQANNNNNDITSIETEGAAGIIPGMIPKTENQARPFIPQSSQRIMYALMKKNGQQTGFTSTGH